MIYAQSEDALRLSMKRGIAEAKLAEILGDRNGLGEHTHSMDLAQAMANASGLAISGCYDFVVSGKWSY